MIEIEVLGEKVARITSRIPSRFEQRKPEDCYPGSSFRFPEVEPEDRAGTMVDISGEAQKHGVKTPLYASWDLYELWVCDGTEDTIRRIASLCHAFLYHVYLDTENAWSLDFTAPFFTNKLGLTPVRVRAILHTGKKKYIALSIAV